MSIYIISNRKVTNNRFSNKGKERARRDFRVAEASIKPTGKVAYEILPENELDGYLELTGYLSGSELKPDGIGGTAAMFANLYEQMLETKDKQSDCLFFIHGFNYTMEDSLNHIKKLHQLYVEPVDSGIDHIVYVAWPTIGHKVGTYWNDQNDAEETGRMLGGLFSKLFLFFLEMFEKEGLERCGNRIHLAVHSMGAEVLEHMMRSIPEQKVFKLFGEILLLNADVRHDVFELKSSYAKLDELGSRTHVYINHSDDALAISTSTKNFKKRLGYKGPKNLNALEGETYVVDTTNAGRANTLKERRFDHWGYLERKMVINDIKAVLRGEEESEIDNRTLVTRKRNYFKLK